MQVFSKNLGEYGIRPYNLCGVFFEERVAEGGDPYSKIWLLGRHKTCPYNYDNLAQRRGFIYFNRRGM